MSTAADGRGNNDLDTLTQELRRRHGDSVNAVLFYGSCLRSGDLREGIVDLYLLVDDYRSTYQSARRALGNWLLPPNVFYAELPLADGRLRCKYAIISSLDFHHGTGHHCFESYFWGRFCQPTAIAWARDETHLNALQQGFRRAAASLLRKAIPRLAPSGTLATLWRDALGLSYAVELRTERSGRVDELVAHDAAHYQQLSRQACSDLPFDFQLQELHDGWHYDARVPAWRRQVARFSWPLRSVAGKCWSVLRLLKALFTFDGGLDYIVWKLERHSGQQVELSPRTRRWPLLFIWGDMWRLYRRGVFR